MHRTLYLAPIALTLACGGGNGQTSTSTTPVTSASAAPTAAPSGAPSAAAEAYDDPSESAVAIEMAPLVKKGTPKSAFPKATTTDGDCWKTVGFSGQHDKDYPALIDKCGTPTGMLEYAKPQTGRLHHIKDAVDSFTVAMNKGTCYRVFAVADSTIHDIDIVILRNGAILGTDDTTQPVAIIQGKEPFCPVDDGNYSFDVKVDGEGKGAYTFGVWARPK